MRIFGIIGFMFRKRPGRTGLSACLAALLFIISMSWSEPAPAATTSCSTFSTPGIVFSSYDTITKAAVDGVGTITFTCTGTGTDTLSIVIYGGNAGVCSPRQMRNGAAPLNYDIYRELGRTNTWCDGASGLDVPMDYSTGATQTKSVTMYGRVSSAQSPSYGSYTDPLNMQLKQGAAILLTSTVSVSGSVSPTCSVSAGTLSFSSYSGSSAALATANLSINCSTGAAYQVSLGSGQNVSGSTRRMLGPSTNYLNYELHRDSGRTLTWGNGTTLGSKLSSTGTGAAQSIPVYGRIPSGQFRTLGSYTDSVVVTVEY